MLNKKGEENSARNLAMIIFSFVVITIIMILLVINLMGRIS